MRQTKSWLQGIHINKVIQFLTYSDIMMMSGWGLITPILAVYFTDNIQGGSIALAGLASTVYFVTKSLIQIPVARMVDVRRGEQDDFYVMIAGSLFITLAAFLYIFVTLPWQVYAVQIIYGIGGALSYPSWLAIFTRHIDKKEEGLEWSLYYTATDLGAALAAGLGGLIVENMGFAPLFVIVGVTSLIGTIFLAGIAHNMRRR